MIDTEITAASKDDITHAITLSLLFALQTILVTERIIGSDGILVSLNHAIKNGVLPSDSTILNRIRKNSEDSAPSGGDR